MSTARAGSSWNRSEVSSERINPSFDGTSATSLISCVCTDILTTLVSGTTTLTPGVRTEDDTLPKKSFTPTLPAGTVRKGPATSLISCVCTDILTTLVSGTTTLTPGVRTEDDTLPKKSLTPTLPAGTVRKGPAARNRMNTSTATTTRPMRDGDGIGTGSRGIL